MPRLICLRWARTHLVGFVVKRLILWTISSENTCNISITSLICICKLHLLHLWMVKTYHREFMRRKKLSCFAKTHWNYNEYCNSHSEANLIFKYQTESSWQTSVNCGHYLLLNWRRIRPQTRWRPQHKTFIRGLWLFHGLGPPWFNRWFCVALACSVVGLAKSTRLCFIIVIQRILCIHYDV